MARAREAGLSWALTLDQDSIAQPTMVARALAAYASDPDPASIGVIAAHIVDAHSGHPYGLMRRPYIHWNDQDAVVKETDFAQTSGSLIPLAVLDRVGPFREELFIDHVDTDFVVRLRRAGYRLLVPTDALILHRLGKKSAARLGRWATTTANYPPIRHYYQARNMVLVFPRLRPWEIQHHTTHWLKTLVKVVLFEEGKWAKLGHVALGLLHGLLGRTGPLDHP